MPTTHNFWGAALWGRMWSTDDFASISRSGDNKLPNFIK